MVVVIGAKMLLVSIQVQAEVSPLGHAGEIEAAMFEALKAPGVASVMTVMNVEVVTFDAITDDEKLPGEE